MENVRSVQTESPAIHVEARTANPAQISQNLQEIKQLWQFVFENSGEGWLISDCPGGQIRQINRAATRIFGYSATQLLGFRLADLFEPASQPAIQAQFQGDTTNNYYHSHIVTNLGNPAGTQEVQLQGRRFNADGQPVVLWHITTLRQFELALQEVQNRLLDVQAGSLAAGKPSQKPALEPLNDYKLLQPLLNVITTQLERLLRPVNLNLLWKGADQWFWVDQQRNQLTAPLPAQLTRLAPFTTILENQQPLLIEWVSHHPTARQMLELWDEEFPNGGFEQVHSWLWLPVELNRQVVAVLSLTTASPVQLFQRQAKLAEAVVKQATMAYTRLYDRGHHAAVNQERQRMARELHDSVTQILYAIELELNTVRTLVERDAPALVNRLDGVLQLAEDGLTELRGLMFDLRPEALQLEGLVAALQKQAASYQVRYGIPIETKLMPEPKELSLPVKEGLYRIAQEALNNIFKHAQASQISLRLEPVDGQLCLEVCDNGRGFNPQQAFPGHFGLQSMRERSAGIGGRLEIESRQGQGSSLRVWLPRSAKLN